MVLKVRKDQQVRKDLRVLLGRKVNRVLKGPRVHKANRDLLDQQGLIPIES
jgi:hypothetical protein